MLTYTEVAVATTKTGELELAREMISFHSSTLSPHSPGLIISNRGFCEGSAGMQIKFATTRFHILYCSFANLHQPASQKVWQTKIMGNYIFVRTNLPKSCWNGFVFGAVWPWQKNLIKMTAKTRIAGELVKVEIFWNLSIASAFAFSKVQAIWA